MHVATDTVWEAVQQDSESAFNALFDAYWQPSFAAAYRVLRDKEAAEDVVQEVFLDLWTRRRALAVHNPEAFIRQMVKNQVFTSLARRKPAGHHVAVLENMLLAHSPEDEYLRRELAAHLQGAVAKLPTKCREVFMLRRDEGLSATRIAEQLNLSIRTVENHLYHAMSVLKKQLYTVMLLLIIGQHF